MKAHMTFNEFMEEIEGKDDAQTIVLDDNSSYEKEWAEAIDKALANAALEAFTNNMRDCMILVLKQDDVSDRHLKWLHSQMNKKIDILDKIIHLSKTEDVPHDEHSEEEGRNPEEEH